MLPTQLNEYPFQRRTFKYQNTYLKVMFDEVQLSFHELINNIYNSSYNSLCFNGKRVNTVKLEIRLRVLLIRYNKTNYVSNYCTVYEV